MSNTENRQIWLLSAANDTLEAYFYSANNPQSRSDEKKVMIKDSSQLIGQIHFWQMELRIYKLGNACSIWFADGFITSKPTNPTEGDDVTVTTKVKNIGTSTANIYTIEIFNDANFDSTAEPGEIIFTQQYTNLAAGDSVTANTIMSSLPAGSYQNHCKCSVRTGWKFAE